EEESRRKTEARAVEDVAAIDERHLRMARSLQARALETLKNAPLGNGVSAVRALEAGIKIERAILGRSEKEMGPTLERLIQASSTAEGTPPARPAPPQPVAVPSIPPLSGAN